MLCEGSPLLFYTPWGPVTTMGMYRGARQLDQRTGERTGNQEGRVTYSFCPRLSRPFNGSLPRQLAQSLAPGLDNLAQSVAPGFDNLALPPSYQGISRPGRDPGGAEI